MTMNLLNLYQLAPNFFRHDKNGFKSVAASGFGYEMLFLSCLPGKLSAIAEGAELDYGHDRYGSYYHFINLKINGPMEGDTPHEVVIDTTLSSPL